MGETSLPKVSVSKLKTFRQAVLESQGGRCALCGEPIADNPVADHDHKTGHHRAVLHRGCNAMLGHFENNLARNEMRGKRAFAWLRAVEGYLTADYSANPLHHTHRTDEQKRLRRNKLAKKARERRKASG